MSFNHLNNILKSVDRSIIQNNAPNCWQATNLFRSDRYVAVVNGNINFETLGLLQSNFFLIKKNLSISAFFKTKQRNKH